MLDYGSGCCLGTNCGISKGHLHDKEETEISFSYSRIDTTVRGMFVFMHDGDFEHQYIPIIRIR